MPTWRFYDGVAERIAGGYQEDWSPSMSSAWLKSSYVFRADIPQFDLTEIVDGITGLRIYPDESINPWYHVPKYADDDPVVLRRGVPIDQGWALSSKLEIDDPFDTHGLLGESQAFYDTWNNKLLWRSPNVYWTPPSDMPAVQHLFIYSATRAQPPIALLSLDAPIGPGPTYEFDWSGGLYDEEEDRFGIVFEIVEA